MLNPLLPIGEKRGTGSPGMLQAHAVGLYGATSAMLATEAPDLFDPFDVRPELSVQPDRVDAAIDRLATMLLIRECEFKIAELSSAKLIGCPCHLAVGQEAVAVGVAAALRPTDRVFGTHRSHSHYLAMKGGVYELFAEVLGRVDGCSSGNGGSMHLIALDKGFIGSVPIVGGTVSLAAGAGLAAKLDGRGDVAIAFFGDGAAEEGVVQETFNIASLMKLPVIFVVENNLFSSHLDLEYRQPAKSVARYGPGHCIPAVMIDGNDVTSVEAAAEVAVHRARTGGGPSIIEAVTFRWFGHVGPNEDIDVGNRRNMDEVLAWKKLDPVKRLSLAILKTDPARKAEIESLEIAVQDEVEVASAKALEAPWPDASMLLADVYRS
jgi:pyruvate dehydrogenase E1 component alpha subunit